MKNVLLIVTMLLGVSMTFAGQVSHTSCTQINGGFSKAPSATGPSATGPSTKSTIK